jgi:putative Mg2+ transporter-C (MgtC) family protein
MSSIWQQISSTVVAEFSDVKDVSELTTITVRLFMAALLGGILGFEREQRGKAAGIKTHMLVAIGSALFVLIPLQAGISDAEMSRVMQGIITGIGFLGAGAILKGHDEKDLKGLTTAAGIWVTSAIGVAAGLGRESLAILCTFLALVVLLAMPKVIGALEGKNETTDESKEK